MCASPPDVEFLVSSEHRVGVLEALEDRPRDRSYLREVTGASSPTIGRVLSDLEERHWIERDGRNYHLTGLGGYVSSRFEEFEDAMAVERRLRQVWPWLPHDVEGFGVELFTDVVVSRPATGYPYRPVERFTALLDDTETMYGFGMAMLKSGNLEPFFDRALDDLECEYIYPPAVFEELLSWDEEAVREATSRSNYTVLLHDDLPLGERCGICVLDDRVSICCYDEETGSLRSLVDTESDDMRSWARSYYERYRRSATPLAEADDVVSVGP